MSIHVVQQGECLSSIAAHYGFRDWHVIYDHPRNAEFKAKRPDPNLIYPGDSLYIPDHGDHYENCATDQSYTFMVKFVPTYFNLRLQDSAEKPLPNVRYKLNLEAVEIESQTDNEGWIRCEIPARSQYGTLTVRPSDGDPTDVITWRVLLGHLDPLDTTSGVKARLNNLGYDCGEIDHYDLARYDAAVREFQRDHGLRVDGIVGPQTRAKLKEKHRV